MIYRIVAFDELNSILRRPFNEPKSEADYSESSFLKEKKQVYDGLKEKLELLGDFDQDETDDEDADFWMQSGGIIRCISVTLNSRKMWNESLIFLIQAFLKLLPKDYFVYVDSSLDLDQPIFILVTKDEAIGSAENPAWLVPFGFKL